MSILNQKTIKKPIHVNGVGLHTGLEVKMKILPSEPNTGIVFKRVDLKENNIVKQVVVVSNDIATTEEKGIEFLNNLYRKTENWKQTSYNSNIRKNFAGVGYTYDEDKDAFIALKPFPSWTLNETTCSWEAPVAYPDDGNYYKWNEETTNWVEIA